MMNKNKMIGLVITGLIFLQLAANAGEKTFFIKGSNIKRGGSLLTTEQIDFSKTLSEPGGAPLSPIFNITGGSVFDNGSGLGRNVQVNVSVGETINAKIWTPAKGAGNYYRDINLLMSKANYDDSNLTWLWDGLAVDYKAEAPYTPAISRFEETVITDPISRVKTLSLLVSSQAGTGSDGLREVSAYAWKMWPSSQSEPANVVPGATQPILTVDSALLAAGETYWFRVNYRNTWDINGTWSEARDYQFGGGTGEKEILATWEVKVSGTGINTIAIPLLNDGTKPIKNASGSEIGGADKIVSVRELINEINVQLNGPKVTIFGWFNAAEQKHYGLTKIVYSGTNIDATNSAITPGTDKNVILNAPIVQDRPYQVSVDDEGRFTLRGFRQ